MHTGPRSVTGRHVERCGLCNRVLAVYSHGCVGVGTSVSASTASDDEAHAFAPAGWETACDNRAARDRPESEVHIT